MGYLQKAQKLKEDSVEVAVGMCELSLLVNKPEEAKKTFEKAYLKVTIICLFQVAILYIVHV
jgi:hypothetical protein